MNQTILSRRQQLLSRVEAPTLFWSGTPQPRNFRANTYPFRASSHFLYFAGLSLENAVLELSEAGTILFWDEPPDSAALWHPLPPRRGELAEHIGATAHYPLAALPQRSLSQAATLPVQDYRTLSQQETLLGRAIGPHHNPQDRALAEAVIQLRLCQDELALAQIQQALEVTLAAHQAGMRQSPSATHEAQIRARMESVILEHQCTVAYTSIVTSHGEVLHNDRSGNPLSTGDLILADVGAEAISGWASDITRTWPQSGKFTPPQRDLYQVVLAAHDACIAALRPGVEYRDIHLLGCQVLTQGLVDLGILRGSVADLVAQDVHALFFPHGIGHLLGLDVHDMEDLGDLAGYAPGRQRSDRFGLCYLRLDRPLQENMVVTIEPGFYQVPSILDPARAQPRYQDWVNWDQLDRFASVRGIRIEDDVWITSTGSEVLSAALPTDPDAIEAIVQEKGL